ncbi:hypothetical protein [Cedecea sp.]|jgi:tetrahydromethanopterin S-methyltransferase subunit A|uniref:hypothetical protein n=1 Tax=Cedecea sp. TaxID=1970739 RepID=UPI002F42E70C
MSVNEIRSTQSGYTAGTSASAEMSAPQEQNSQKTQLPHTGSVSGTNNKVSYATNENVAQPISSNQQKQEEMIQQFQTNFSMLQKLNNMLQQVIQGYIDGIMSSFQNSLKSFQRFMAGG